MTAGNYGGNLGPHHIELRGLVPGLRRLMPLTLTPPRAADGAARDRGPQPRIDSPVFAAREIEALTVWHGNRQAQLADFFTVSGDGDEELRLEGDLRSVKFIGAGMTAGRLDRRGRCGNAHRRGDAGRRAGRGR